MAQESHEELSIEDQFARIRELYEGDHFIKAIAAWKAVKQAVEQLPDSEEEEGEGEKGAYLNTLATDPVLIMVEQCAGEMGDLLESFNNLDVWTPNYEKDGIQTYTREGEAHEILFRVDGTCRANTFSCMASIYEVDLLKDWIPACSKSDKLRTVTKFRLTLKLTFPLFWPFSPRLIVAEGYGDVREEDGRVVIFAKSLSPERLEEEKQVEGSPLRKLDEEGGFVLMDILGGFIFRPTPLNGGEEEGKEEGKEEEEGEGGKRDETDMTIIFRANPRVDIVPQSLVNYVLKNFCGYVIPMLSKHAKKFDEGGELQHRIGENSEVYEELRKRLEEAGH